MPHFNKHIKNDCIKICYYNLLQINTPTQQKLTGHAPAIKFICSLNVLK